jgi:hypothetical protein
MCAGVSVLPLGQSVLSLSSSSGVGAGRQCMRAGVPVLSFGQSVLRRTSSSSSSDAGDCSGDCCCGGRSSGSSGGNGRSSSDGCCVAHGYSVHWYAAGLTRLCSHSVHMSSCCSMCCLVLFQHVPFCLKSNHVAIVTFRVCLHCEVDPVSACFAWCGLPLSLFSRCLLLCFWCAWFVHTPRAPPVGVT